MYTVFLSLNKRFLSVFLLPLLWLAAPHSLAQITFGPQAEADLVEHSIRDLSWMNFNFLDKQRKTADTIARGSVGRQFHKGRADLRVLQRVIDSGTLEGADKLTLQSMGAILGDVFVSAHKKLNWKVYEDDLGATHAVCIDDTSECVFPMTMISRRMEGGVTPNVQVIFDNTMATLKPHMPHVPYARD